jgi:hypothetical protein
MRRLIRALDDALEGAATFVYGELAEGEERPSLWTKLGRLAVFAVLLLLGLAASLKW